MAETPFSSHPTPPPPPPPPSPPSVPTIPDSTQYWCHGCDKRVAVETLPDQPDIICFECKNGFVELISAHHHHLGLEINDEDQPNFGNEFLQVLRLIAQAADNDAPPLPPADRGGDGDVNDYLRIELDRWNENDNDDENGDVDEYDDGDEGDENRNQIDLNRDGSDDHNVNEDEDLRRRQRRDVIRLHLRDFASGELTRQNRILALADMLMGLEDRSIGFQFQVPGSGDGYIGNPGDYVDADGFNELLETLAESDNGGKKGSPPAAKSAIEALPTVGKLTETEVCAICKDKVFNNENEIVKQLPCGHMYHEDCIVPWLGSRNTCPICRFELPTDDPEYEEDRRKRSISMDTATSAGSGDAV